MELNLDFFEESDKQAITELAPKEVANKEYMPIAYRISKISKESSLFGTANFVNLQTENIDTIRVEQGRFEQAKGLAVKKAKMIGYCVVVELTNVPKNINGRTVIQTVERIIIEVKERSIQSETILYKSGHKRRRAKNL